MTTGYPSLLIAAPQGRSGKTTYSLGLCTALAKRGLRVQPFKKGPDYIDPSWLSAAAGHQCRTLDPFFQQTNDKLLNAFMQGMKDADFGLIEGNHGLYDSVDKDGRSSSAAVAQILGIPIILVINAARMGRSSAAMVLGYQSFDPETPIAGVVLNNVAGKRHESKLRTAIETHCTIPVIGAIRKDKAVTIPDRHLGLIPRGENSNHIAVIEGCRKAVEQCTDIDQAVSIAQGKNKTPSRDSHGLSTKASSSSQNPLIGVIRDKAFSFYYPENFEALERSGAKILFIDSFSVSELPAVDTLYIGGGFPEIFFDELESNHSLRHSIRSEIEKGLPVYAECGGLMYLSERIYYSERSAEMVGALPHDVEICNRPQGHGYVIAEVTGSNPFWSKGEKLHGHEFHNSRLRDLDSIKSTAYQIERGSGLGNGRDGLVYRNILASYTHLHADGSPGWADGIVSRACQYAEVRSNG